MTNLDFSAFTALFKEAYLRCFGHALENPMTETESKLLCNNVLDQTGLSIGWKSVKNYSFFISDSKTAKSENPSVATLDTLARYVLKAPYTTEIKRKTDEAHYPYWFLYREQFQRTDKIEKPKRSMSKRWFALIILLIIASSVIILNFGHKKEKKEFTDNFKSVAGNALADNGWLLQNAENHYWNKRDSTAGRLTLFTLKGDNWPDPANKPGIKNLLLRVIPYDCFTAEVHLSNFIPEEEWQQAGVLLLEDTLLTSKSIRLSIAFNDNFGGYIKHKEVLVQAITSLGNGFGKPEEIAHHTIVYLDSIKNKPSVLNYLSNSALRIEKHGSRFRFLYAGGVAANGAFREVVSQDFDMQPKYIGIFAIKGFMDNSAIIPASFTYFRITGSDCGK